MTTRSEPSLIYVFDAYCGWCYGFGPHLAEFLATAEVPGRVRIVSGGLFVGDRVAPPSAYGYIEESNRRISEATGAVFSTAYRALMADEGFVLDSGAAARGFAALRGLAPERALDIATAMQHAFYGQGRSLSAPQTYAQLAQQLRVDPGRVLDALVAPATAAAAAADFAEARALGVTEFPTLLVQLTGDRLGRVGNATSTAAQLAEQMSIYRLANAGPIGNAPMKGCYQ